MLIRIYPHQLLLLHGYGNVVTHVTKYDTYKYKYLLQLQDGLVSVLLILDISKKLF